MALLSHPAVAAFCALFVWWFSTGAVLYVVGRPAGRSLWGLGGAVLLFIAALFGLAKTSTNTNVVGAYAAFVNAIVLWGTQEFVFLTGFVTGPRNQPCPDDCRGWRRVVLAIESVIYHEVALIVTGGAVVAVTWNGSNQIGVWTFVILWVMRVSSKVNLFAGVPVLNHEFLPPRLGYLASFFSKGPVNPFLPCAVTAATAIAMLLLVRSLGGDASPFQSTGDVLLASLLALGVLEHWFMIVPLPIAALWSWGMRSRTARPDQSSMLPLAKNAPVRGVANSMRDQ
jgi:putative photosynthetic complex assembly protein 2